MTSTSTPLIELLMRLLRDPAALEEFRDDPDDFLASCGDVSAEDVRDAITLLRDRHDGGGNHVHLPSPPAPHKHHGESDHDATIRYINNYYTEVDDRDTYVDNSIHQEVDTDGGDFDQHIDVDSQVVSGDGAVGAGGDIENSRIATGDDNIIGDDNVEGRGNVVGEHNQAATGDRSTTAFGQGDASSNRFDDVSVGRGGSFSTGEGGSSADNTDNSTSGSYNDESNHSIRDSYNSESEYTEHTDNSTSHSYNEDTHTTTETDNSVVDSYNTHT